MKENGFLARLRVCFSGVYLKITCIAVGTLFSLLWHSCTSPASKAPDVSSIKIDLHTARFDKDFGAIDTNHIGAGLVSLKVRYPGFLDYYLDTFMDFGTHGNYEDSSTGVRNLRPWLTFKDFVNLQKEIERQYPDTKDVDARLTQGFKYLKYYFPSVQVPDVIYMNVYLSRNSTFMLDTATLCIGLDWFLGDDFPPYTAIGEPYYIGAFKRRSYLPVSAFKTLFLASYPFRTADKTLLDLMIYQGKKQYFLHKVLPNTPDSVLFGFPQHKLDWCEKNEALVYNFFVHQQLLYNKEPQNIMPYVNEGPFAVNIPDSDPAHNTPGNIGSWLGYRIVSAYMEQNPTITLQQLIDQKIESSQILDAAKYRPK